MCTIFDKRYPAYLLGFILLFIGAQTVLGARQTTHKRDSLKLFHSYLDSLQNAKSRVFAANQEDMKATQPQQEYDEKYYKLFLPLTFYHAPAIHQLYISYSSGLDEPEDVAQTMVDDVLTQTYLNYPDYVSNSERNIRRAGAIRKNDTQLKKQDITFTKHVAPQPEEIEDIPVGILIKKPNFWTFSGDSKLQFLQNYISDNWYKGGESNYSMVGNLTLEANYNNKSKFKWDNKLELKLGFKNSKEDTLHKFKTNNDLIRYTGKVGLQATKNWYYTLQFLAYTQFARGLKSNDPNTYSDFMSPLDLNLGLGMDYSVNAHNGRLKGSVNLSVLSFHFRYVDRKNLASRHGIIGDHHTLEEFGSQITASLTWNICDQVKWNTRYYMYTTYKNVLMEWENTISLQVSKYISANIFLYPRFDDSTKRDEDYGYFQFTEYSSLGFAYSF